MQKQDPTVEILSDNYFDAHTVWIDFWGNQQDAIPSFANFLGMSGGITKHNLSPRYKTYTFKIRQSAARKIMALCGPHSYALLKAYQINHPRKLK